MRPGDPLVEAVLAERYGISKTPVREALIRLRRDGLVESRPHRVTRVATPTVADILQVSQLRTWIETQIWAECAKEPPPELLMDLEESIATATAALEEGDVERYGDSIRRFTDRVLSQSGNQYAVQALQRLRNILDLIANIARETPGRQRRSVEEHNAIVEALRARDPEATAAAVRLHLDSIARDSIEAVELLAEDRERERPDVRRPAVNDAMHLPPWSAD
jgi:DNA-binding GntR family transcriptional regulator